MLFIEETSPPPFYQPDITPAKRRQLDKWFIGTRSQAYYLQRFEQFDKQGYLSPKWHWAAFFSTFGWLLYRKRYLDTIVYTVAGWSFIQLNIVVTLAILEFALIPYVAEAYQMATRLAIAALIWLFWAVMVARWSDAYYYRMARREIADVIDYYPQDETIQEAHLKREGGVSSIGLGIALSLFAFFLLIIQVQFLPLYAKPQATNLIQDAYQVTQMASRRVGLIYEQQQKCPVGMPLATSEQNLTLTVTDAAAQLGNRPSDCIVTATLTNIGYPNRNLNGKQIVFYHPLKAKSNKDVGNNTVIDNNNNNNDNNANRPEAGGTDSRDAQSLRWQCISSFNAKQTPKGCQINDEQ